MILRAGLPASNIVSIGRKHMYRYLIVYTFADGFQSDELVEAVSFIEAISKLRDNHIEEITHFTLIRKEKIS